MKAMGHEQSKSGSLEIKRILDEIKVATAAVKVAEEKRLRNDQELIIAKNKCEIGQPGGPSPFTPKDDLDFDA